MYVYSYLELYFNLNAIAFSWQNITSLGQVVSLLHTNLSLFCASNASSFGRVIDMEKSVLEIFGSIRSILLRNNNRKLWMKSGMSKSAKLLQLHAPWSTKLLPYDCCILDYHSNSNIVFECRLVSHTGGRWCSMDSSKEESPSSQSPEAYLGILFGPSLVRGCACSFVVSSRWKDHLCHEGSCEFTICK